MWILALLACGSPEPNAAVVVVVDSPAEARAVVVRDHAGEVGQTLKHLARVERSLAQSPDAYAPNAQKAALLATLSRLRGGTADAEAADLAAAKAWAAAPDQPTVKRAWAASLQRSHRFREALDVMEGLNDEGDVAMRAVMAFELGDYETSVQTLLGLVEGKRFPNPTTSSRLAGCLWKLGRYDEAETWMNAAQSNFHGRENWVRAWYHLMLGLMDLERDRLDDAMGHYEAADAALPGWWLIEEHQAEIHQLQGRPEIALPLYEAAVETTGSPELMGALADTLQALDRLDDAATWRARAMETFDQQLAQNPASAGGHALEFFLEHGDPERAVELARANVDLRPNGEAKLLLAEALKGVDRTAEAEALVAEVEASGWPVP